MDLFAPTRLDRLRQLFEEGSAAASPKAAAAAEPPAPPAPVSDEALQRAVLAQSSREQLALSGAGNVAAAAAAVLGEEVLGPPAAPDQAPAPPVGTLDRSALDRPDWQALLEATGADGPPADASYRDLPVARAVLALSSQQGARPAPELQQPFRELGYDTVSGKLDSLSRILHVVQQSAAEDALAADEPTPPGLTEPGGPAPAVGEQSVWGMFSEVSSVAGDLSTADLSPHDDTLEPPQSQPQPADAPAAPPVVESARALADAAIELPAEASQAVAEPPPAAVPVQASLDEASAQSVRRAPEAPYGVLSPVRSAATIPGSPGVTPSSCAHSVLGRWRHSRRRRRRPPPPRHPPPGRAKAAARRRTRRPRRCRAWARRAWTAAMPAAG